MDAVASRVTGGHVSCGFERVREAFEENFARRQELGGACCAYLEGHKVVDLWGGIRNRKTGEPWEPDTMVVVHSATKGLAAMTLALAHSHGWLDYEERVATYWPEFAQNGKEKLHPFRRRHLPPRSGTRWSAEPCRERSWRPAAVIHAATHHVARAFATFVSRESRCRRQVARITASSAAP